MAHLGAFDSGVRIFSWKIECEMSFGGFNLMICQFNPMIYHV